MSDPLSIAAGVVGVMTAAAQISSLLINFTRQSKDAPRQAAIVLTEVTETSGILSHLQSFLLGTEIADQSRTCFLQVDHVVAIVTGCVATFSELEEILDSLKTEGMYILDRIKWARKESTIMAIVTRLQTHKASLSLMLNILNGNTMQEAKNSVEVLCTTMDHHYQEILNRVQALEWQQSSQTNGRIITSELNGINGESEQKRTIPPVENSVIKRCSSKVYTFVFEKDLSLTAVYKKIKFRRSISSLVSVDRPATRWSTLSGLSVADAISRISVLSLAIAPAEVYNESRYVVSSTDELSAFPQPPQEQIQPQPNHEIAQARKPTVGIFKEADTGTILLAASRKADTRTVLLAALKTYKINATWQMYSLYIVYGDVERRLGQFEKPVAIFNDLDPKGMNPRFVLRRNARAYEYLPDSPVLDGWFEHIFTQNSTQK